jgi:hypothetical protein
MLLITIVGHSNIHTPNRMLNLSSILHVPSITKFFLLCVNLLLIIMSFF